MDIYRCTGRPKFYKLNVRVESDRVVVIDLGNGETVHAGRNNSGDVYSGGRISFERDWSANVVKLVNATVTAQAKDGHILKFKIQIGSPP